VTFQSIEQIIVWMPSGSRMMRFVDLLQALFDNMGIYLRRRNIRMSQHHLHGAKIGTTV